MPNKKHPVTHPHHHHKAKASDHSVLLSRTKLSGKSLITVIALLIAVGLFLVYRSFAASATMSLVPASASPALGSSFTVTIHENSGSTSANAVTANLTYDQTKLQFVKIDASTTAFTLTAPSLQSGGGGNVSFSGGAAPAVTGDQIVAVVTFTAIGAGTTPINFAASSQLVESTNNTNILTSTTGGSYTIADTTKPSVPTGLTAGAKTVNSLAFSWTASTDNVGVTGYNVFRNGTKLGTSAGTSFSDTGLAPSTSYSYTLQAFDAAGNTSTSSTALAMTTLADTTPPSVPAGLTAGAKTVTTTSLTWSASTDNVGVTGYKVFRNGTQIGTPVGTSYSDSGLTPNTSYLYTVASRDGVGNTSAQSAALAISTLADTTPPSVPSGLVSTGQTASSIGLAWNPSTDNVGVTGYKIFRGGTQVGTSPSNSFNDTGLAQGATYSYTVAATDGPNTSAQSAASSFATVNVPGDVNGDGHVTLTDLSILAAHWQQSGMTRAQGDLNGDGVVNVFDLSILATYWGT